MPSRELEAVLEQHAGLRQAAVVGIGDPTWGERVCAMVIAALGGRANAQELQSHCRRCLAGYRTPKCILFTDAQPVNAAGKVDKATIRALISARKTS